MDFWKQLNLHEDNLQTVQFCPLPEQVLSRQFEEMCTLHPDSNIHELFYVIGCSGSMLSGLYHGRAFSVSRLSRLTEHCEHSYRLNLLKVHQLWYKVTISVIGP